MFLSAMKRLWEAEDRVVGEALLYGGLHPPKKDIMGSNTSDIHVSPPSVRIRACDVKPYFYGLWCSIQEGTPFVNDIVVVSQKDDGTLAFMLDSHNFLTGIDPNDVIELVPLRKPGEWAINRYQDWVLPGRERYEPPVHFEEELAVYEAWEEFELWRASDEDFQRRLAAHERARALELSEISAAAKAARKPLPPEEKRHETP